MTLREAHARGGKAAFAHFKIAGPGGADMGVQPKGDEVSHGTERVQYAKRETPGDGASAVEAGSAVSNMPDWLWDTFTTYDHTAPGRADGTWGQEVIG